MKTYCHVLPGWFKIGATGGTLLPLQKSSAKRAGHLAGPGLVNMIRELWVGLNKRPLAVGQLSKTKFFILEYHSRTTCITIDLYATALEHIIITHEITQYVQIKDLVIDDLVTFVPIHSYTVVLKHIIDKHEMTQ